ncbi:MAG: PadR family transcriptional regulator [Chloroflexota bacterium]
MKHDRGAAGAARYAILGLLLDRPSHGYDLARHFATTSAIGDVIHLSASHLYALLAHLERDDLISGEQEDAGTRPQRRVYSLTTTGREAVDRWMDEPVLHPRDMRIEFPLKLYIAQRSASTRAARLIERQRAVFTNYITRLEEQQTRAESVTDAAFIHAVRSGRIGRARVAIAWLDDYAQPLTETR